MGIISHDIISSLGLNIVTALTPIFVYEHDFSLDRLDVITNAAEKLRGSVNWRINQITDSVSLTRSLTGVIAGEDITLYTDLITRAAFSLDERLDHTFHVTSALTFEVATTVTLDKIKRTNSITN
jgi:hypothetical protein